MKIKKREIGIRIWKFTNIWSNMKEKENGNCDLADNIVKLRILIEEIDHILQQLQN